MFIFDKRFLYTFISRKKLFLTNEFDQMSLFVEKKLFVTKKIYENLFHDKVIL